MTELKGIVCFLKWGCTSYLFIFNLLATVDGIRTEAVICFQSHQTPLIKNSNFTLQNTGDACLLLPQSESLCVLLCDFGESKLTL